MRDRATCPGCGKKFTLSKKQKQNLRYGRTKRAYCSHSCYSKHIDTRKIVKCAYCGKEFLPTGSQWWWYTKGPNKNIFCSNICVGQFYSGERKYNWNGRKSIDERGYVRVELDGKGGYVYEHRAIMEELLGRKLKPDDVVHHINGNKQDNRPENLFLMTNSEHAQHHATLQWENRRAVNVD